MSAGHAAMESIALPIGGELYCLNRNEAMLLYRDLFEERSYFQFGIEVRPGDTVVDVGANIGLFALQASREADDVRVIALEPLPPIFAILQANYERRGIAGVALPYGVGRRDETVPFTFYPGNSALSGRFADAEQDQELVVRLLRNRYPKLARSGVEALARQGLAAQTFACPIKPLAAILREAAVARIGLLKIDVEKAELEVLESVGDEHWPDIEQVVVEVHDLDDRLRRTCRLLEARGFAVRHRQGATFAGTGLHDVFASRRWRDEVER